MAIMVSSRLRQSRGELAWRVVSDPSWPVFIAWSMSTASPPRHSPMMIRSGRMRSALMSSSRCGTSPWPSMLAGRVSSRTTCGWRSWSSAESSMVTIRSVGGMNDERMLSSVVLPAPVPPEMMHVEPRLHDALQQLEHRLGQRSRSAAGPRPTSASRRNFRMETWGPSSASGLMIALTRRAVRQPGVHHRRRVVDPAADRGDDPVDDLEQVAVVLEPDVGLLQPAVPLDEDLLARCSPGCRRSPGSWISGSSGPRPKISSRTWLTSASRSSKLSGTISWEIRSWTTFRIASTTWSRLDPVEAGEVEPLDQPAVDPALDLLEVVRSRRRLTAPSAVGRAGRGSAGGPPGGRGLGGSAGPGCSQGSRTLRFEGPEPAERRRWNCRSSDVTPRGPLASAAQ